MTQDDRKRVGLLAGDLVRQEPPDQHTPALVHGFEAGRSDHRSVRADETIDA
jgi:hypothetical protein